MKKHKDKNPALFALMEHNKSRNDSLRQGNNSSSSSIPVAIAHNPYRLEATAFVDNATNSTPVTPRGQIVSNESSSVAVTTPDLYQVQTRLISNREALVRTRLNFGS